MAVPELDPEALAEYLKKEGFTTGKVCSASPFRGEEYTSSSSPSTALLQPYLPALLVYAEKL